MASDQYCLKWNNHQSNLVGVFDSLLQAEALVDVTLSCEGQTLRAHKLVLSACSPYFQTLFTSHPESHPIVILKDVTFTELQSLISFIYKGEVSVEQEDLHSLLKTAEGLKIRGLTDVASSKRNSTEEETTKEESQLKKRKIRDIPGEDTSYSKQQFSSQSDTLPAEKLAALNVETVIKTKSEPSWRNDDDSHQDDEEGMVEDGPRDTTYLCPVCGQSFANRHYLSLHLESHHSTPRLPPPPVLQPPPSTPLANQSLPSSMALPVLPLTRLDSAADDREGRSTTSVKKEHPIITLPYHPPRSSTPPKHSNHHSVMDEAIDMTAISVETELGGPSSVGCPVTCKYCTRVFDTIGNLLDHMTVHQGDRPFRCDFCGKAFKFRHHLKDHCRIHTGERPFQCNICGKSFGRSSILKTHSKIHLLRRRGFEVSRVVQQAFVSEIQGEDEK
nr:tramtrack p88 [Chrysogorgia stellata]